MGPPQASDVKLGDGQIWLAIAGLVVLVFVTRNLFMVLPQRWQPRGALERALRHAPLAALAALVVPQAAGSLLASHATPASVWQDGRLPAAVVALLVARLARNPFAGLASGTVVLLVIGALA